MSLPQELAQMAPLAGASSVDGLRMVTDILAAVFSITAFGLAVVVFRTNPKRTLNQALAAILIVSATWQMAIVAATTVNEGLPWLRLSTFIATFGLMLDAVFLDAVLFHNAPLRDRVHRQWPLLAGALLASAIVLTNWWIPYSSTSGHKVSGPMLGPVLVFSVLFPAVLIAKAIMARGELSPTQRLELQNFIVLNILLLLEEVLFAIPGLRHRNVAHLGVVLVGGYYLITTRLMVDTRALTMRDASYGAMRFGFGILTRFAIILPVFALVLSLPLWQGAFALAICVVFMNYVADAFVGMVFKTAPDQKQEIARARIAALVGEEWIENRLIQSFAAVLREFLPAERVEILRFNALPAESGTKDRALLINTAIKHGWLTRQLAYRAADPEDLDSLLRGFSDEHIDLAVIHRFGAGALGMLVELQSSISLIPGKHIKFLGESIDLLRGGLERIRLARKALHNDRMATVGFLASQISHESRNRLDAIIASLKLLKDGNVDDITQEHRELLHISALEFAADLNRNLDMARAEMGVFEYANAHVIIEEAIAFFSMPNRSNNLLIRKIFCSDSAMVYVDARIVRQVLHNLLRNASDAISDLPGPAITIRTTSTGDVFRIEVEDNGSGVPADIHDQLFTEFCTTKPSGTGLGLSFCRDSLAIVNGSIEYLTPRGQPHACFAVTLETKGPPTAEETAPKKAKASRPLFSGVRP